MKILLDECIPRKLRAQFTAHQCLTAPQAGFAGKKNGQLLAAAQAAGFEVFITVDKGVEYQRHLSGYAFATIVLRAKSNRLIDLVPLVPECLTILARIRPGEVVRVANQRDNNL